MITVSPRLIAYGVVSALLIGSHAAMYAGGALGKTRIGEFVDAGRACGVMP